MRVLTSILEHLRLPAVARSARRADRRAPPGEDPGIDLAVRASAAWLARAQDMSASSDGGIARSYSLLSGWATSYPETTGYIVPTLLRLADVLHEADYRDRARRALDWLMKIQLPGGGYQGGKVDAVPVVPVTFNTGQILIGLACGARRWGDAPTVAAMHGAARFLRDSLDDDGCWRKNATPFAQPGDKAYETHVAWGLFEAERVAPGEGYGAAGLRQVDWALTRMADNGWVADCCLTDPSAPLTHTLGYYLRGVVEAHHLSDDPRYLNAALKMAQALIGARRADGALPGRLRADWSPAVGWSCLTGNVQIAESLFYLAAYGGGDGFVEAGRRLNAFVRRTIAIDADPDRRGGVRGSWPIDGDYGRFEYLNWAAKFAIDSFLIERGL